MIASQWVWLAVALPLAGFLVNGALALRRAPAKLAVSIVGPGVLLGAFAVSARRLPRAPRAAAARAARS